MAETKYKRVLLKLSGEAFSGKTDYGIDTPTLIKVAKQIRQVIEMGVGIAIIVGGGNIWRGAKAEQEGMDRVTADYAGMLATVINALALQDALEKEGVTTAAALRAIEIEAEVLLMTKNNVDGVYSADPRKDHNAKKFDRLTHFEALNKRLEVMDATALSLCLENKLPIIVFDLQAPRSIERAVIGDSIGTLISGEK